MTAPRKAATKAAPVKRGAKVRRTATTHTPSEPLVLPDLDSAEGGKVGKGGGMTLATVPPKSVAAQYISRTLVGGIKDFDMLTGSRKNMWNVLIEGPTGPGKTMFTKAWAALNDQPIARVPCHVGIEPGDLFGKYVPSAGSSALDHPLVAAVMAGEMAMTDEAWMKLVMLLMGQGAQFEWVDGPVTHVARYGGVVLINEVNFMPDRVSSVLFGLFDDSREIVLQAHHGEIIRAHRPTVTKWVDGKEVTSSCWCDDPGGAECESKWVLVVADMNPDYEGTRPLNKAFRNRFAQQQAWDYDPVVEARLIRSKSLLTMAKQIRDEAAKGTFDTPLATNMLMEFEATVKEFGLEYAFANFQNHYEASIERDVIKGVINTHRANIARDFAPKPKGDEAPQPVDQGKGYADRDSKYDPAWDVYGVDWLYSDEA